MGLSGSYIVYYVLTFNCLNAKIKDSFFLVLQVEKNIQVTNNIAFTTLKYFVATF